MTPDHQNYEGRLSGLESWARGVNDRLDGFGTQLSSISSKLDSVGRPNMTTWAAWSAVILSIVFAIGSAIGWGFTRDMGRVETAITGIVEKTFHESYDRGRADGLGERLRSDQDDLQKDTKERIKAIAESFKSELAHTVETLEARSKGDITRIDEQIRYLGDFTDQLESDQKSHSEWRGEMKAVTDRLRQDIEGLDARLQREMRDVNAITEAKLTEIDRRFQNEIQTIGTKDTARMDSTTARLDQAVQNITKSAQDNARQDEAIRQLVQEKKP